MELMIAVVQDVLLTMTVMTLSMDTVLLTQEMMFLVIVLAELDTAVTDVTNQLQQHATALQLMQIVYVIMKDHVDAELEQLVTTVKQNRTTSVSEL
jgi:hypothetical protein